MKEQDYIDSKHIAANTNDYRIEEVHRAFDMIDKWEFAKEQVIKELIWLMGETPVNTDGTPDALDVSVIEERCEKFEQELKQK
jgi:hypothetical protein